MVVEINFIEEKKKKIISPVFIILLLVVILLIGGGGFYQIQTLAEQEQKLSEVLTNYQNQRENLSQMVEEESHDSFLELQSEIEKWKGNEGPYLSDTTQKMISLLPGSGSIETFAFQNNVVNLSTRFNSLSEISLYTKNLQKANYFNKIQLHEINQIPNGEYYLAVYEIQLKEGKENVE